MRSNRQAGWIGKAVAVLVGSATALASPPPVAGMTDGGDVDDGLSAPAEPFVARVAGDYDLWEDTEGGQVCRITLQRHRVIGGYGVAVQDPDCLQVLELDGDPYAWFIADDGALVVLDAARTVLLRMPPNRGGGGVFYQRRDDQGRRALMLSLP